MMDITQLLKLPWEGTRVRSEEQSSGSAFFLPSGMTQESATSSAWGMNPALLPTPTGA